MLSYRSEANLKVVGIDGLSPEMIRSEVERGAKFVIYSYNFSLLVMSFKRPSNIYFVGAGQNPVIKGLPFTLISLVFGWWGIPWGIIYTFQSLGTNLSGGKDVTDAIVASLAPKPASAGSSVMPPPAPMLPARPRKTVRQWLPAATVVVGLFALVYLAMCFFYGQNMPVALVSGLPTAYSVELNGQRYNLPPNHAEVLKLSEGEFRLRGAPGLATEQTFTAKTEFWSRPFDHHVLVINPDRAALVARQTVHYHPSGSTPSANDHASVQLHVNQMSYALDEPDYFFADFPTQISMSSGETQVQKSRLTLVTGLSLENRASFISEQLGYGALREYLGNFARLMPDDETLQRLLWAQVKPEDARAILETRLGDRPVRVDWHRAYQGLMDAKFPSVDLLARYRAWSEADPENGDLLYLYARLLNDPAKDHPLYQRSLQVKRPSAYGAYALAVDAFVQGHYAETLADLRQAEQLGLHNDSLELRKTDALFALGRTDDVLAGVRAKRVKNPADGSLFEKELVLVQSRKADRMAGQRAIAAYVSGMKARFGDEDSKVLQQYMTGRLAYAIGEEAEASAALAKVAGPYNQFEAAIDRRDHAAAAKAIAGVADPQGFLHWILVIAATAKSDSAAADKYFQETMAILARTDRWSRQIAQAAAGAAPPNVAETLRTPAYANELRVMFTALGLRYPEQREIYFARAAELNHDPDFPHLLLAEVLKRP